MITDHIHSIDRYKPLGSRLAQAMEYLQQTDFAAMQPGKYEVDGDNIFAIVNEFTTKPAEDCEPEAHRKYIDIQYMVSGVEKFGWTPLNNYTPTTTYSEENDVAFYTVEHMHYLTLSAGMFIIFFPADIHQPEVFADKPSEVKKVVMKIKI
ncbi:YhcH/YjgK/YiaL family protein [Chitinophagaceae bacterium MMS25-I14]